MSVDEHKAAAPASVRLFVLTVSDTRTEATDTAGGAIAALLAETGHVVAGRRIVRDEPSDVRATVAERIASGEVDAIITTGGTGVSARDTTYEAITGLFDKRLDGFGELFRMLSFAEIGPAAMLSRATAGIAGKVAIFVLPGSENAVRLALSRLVIPELGHVVRELRR